MVVTKFDEEDWGESNQVVFDSTTSIEELKCTADGELALLRKKNVKTDSDDDIKIKKITINKTNTHARKKSLLRLEKYKKMQIIKSVELKEKAIRNKYKKKEEDSESVDDKNVNQDEKKILSNDNNDDSKITNKKRKLSVDEDKVEDVTHDEVTKNKKKKKPARNNKFKPKIEKNPEDKLIPIVNDNIKDSTKITDSDNKIKSKSKKQSIIKTQVLEEDTKAKSEEKKMKKKLRKLKKKEEAKLEKESKINKQEFLERIVVAEPKSEVSLGKSKKKLDSKRLKEMVDTSETKKEKNKKEREQPKSLKERMEIRLDAAHFRHLNEKLYTQTSDQSYEMFSIEGGAYESYHRGYTSQVSRWPENPVDRAIQFIKSRRTELIVADLGCGDAKIAASVKNSVYSFDLMASNARVQVCNINQVPLLSKNVDIAVFCLSLMGTDFVSFIVEANRIMKVGATLIIAEVVSRFEDVGVFMRQLEKLGFTLKKKDDKNKMFIWFEFLKTMDTPSGTSPDLILNPCVYKKR